MTNKLTFDPRGAAGVRLPARQGAGIRTPRRRPGVINKEEKWLRVKEKNFFQK